MFKKIAVLIGCITIVSCGTLPVSGPYKKDISKGSAIKIQGKKKQTTKNESVNFDYAAVELNKISLQLLNQEFNFSDSLSNWPNFEPPQTINVDVNDTLQITIYEAQSGGLFVPKEAGVRPGNFISLPPQTISQSGTINVPYVGEVRAAGRTPQEISNYITLALKNRAISPQVVVSYAERGGSAINVIGDVLTPTRFSLNFNGETVLDSIARAGGIRSPGYETKITLQRATEEYTTRFDALILDSKKNVYVKPNDTIYIYREPEIFTVYGATEVTGNFPFGKSKLFLAEAIGKAQGLVDLAANPAAVFIYRQEPLKRVEVLEKTLVTKPAQKTMIKHDSLIPVIYALDLRDPRGFFIAQKFSMKNNDIIYVANAGSVEFFKFLTILSGPAVSKRNYNDAF